MKIIEYKLPSGNSVKLNWTPENEKIAKQEAHNGDYVIVDDGQPEPEPTADDIVNAFLGVN